MILGLITSFIGSTCSRLFPPVFDIPVIFKWSQLRSIPRHFCLCTHRLYSTVGLCYICAWERANHTWAGGCVWKLTLLSIKCFGSCAWRMQGAHIRCFTSPGGIVGSPSLHCMWSLWLRLRRVVNWGLVCLANVVRNLKFVFTSWRVKKWIFFISCSKTLNIS